MISRPIVSLLALGLLTAAVQAQEVPEKKGRGRVARPAIRLQIKPAQVVPAPVTPALPTEAAEQAEPAPLEEGAGQPAGEAKPAENLTPEQKLASMPTHEQTTTIAPRIDGKPVTIQTFTVDREGNLWVCTTQPVGQTPARTKLASSKELIRPVPGLLVVVAPDGKISRTLELEFVATAINFTADGKLLFVAGNGKVAKLTPEGEVLKVIDSPSLSNLDDMRDKVIADLKEQAKSRTQLFADQIKRYEEMIALMEKTKEKDRTEAQQAQLKALNQQLEAYRNYLKQYTPEELNDTMVQSAIASKLGINALAVTADSVFVSCTTLTGYGYDVWKLDHELEGGKLVLEKLRGCCGRMDIQTDGSSLWVAENTKFRVGQYSLTGEPVGFWGKQDREAIVGFGSCCNPMNVHCCANGDVLTSESSIGKIKRFSPDGKLLGYVGQATIGGGCKNVPIGFDETRNVYYMLNTTANHICVLTPKVEQKTAQAE